MMYLSPRKKVFVDAASKLFGAGTIINRDNVKTAADDAGIPFPWWFTKHAKVGYNQFQLPAGGPETATTPMTSATPVASTDAQVNLQPAPKVSLSVETTAFTENLVPAVDP